MAQSRLHTRLQRLEQSRQAQQAGMLYVWRLPEETEAEACVRCEVDPEDFPQVRVRVWIGGRVSSRLACPPAPAWLPAVPSAATPHEAPLIAERTRKANAGLARVRRGLSPREEPTS